jgi:hypothetical protein
MKEPMPPTKCKQGHTHQVFGCNSCNELIKAWKRYTSKK